MATFDRLEHMLKGSRNDSPFVEVVLISFHGVRLPCSGLTIGKDCSIITFQHTFDDGQSRFLEYCLLLDCGFEHHVECEDFVVLALFTALNRHLSSRGVDVYNAFVPLLDFVGGHWSAA